MKPLEQPIPIEIDCHNVKTELDDNRQCLLLDCREEHELEVVRLKRARSLPMSQLPARLTEIEEYRGRPIIVFCHLGARSLQVAGWLRAQGFHSVQSMTGGIDRWAVEIDTNLRRY